MRCAVLTGWKFWQILSGCDVYESAILNKLYGTQILAQTIVACKQTYLVEPLPCKMIASKLSVSHFEEHVEALGFSIEPRTKRQP